MSGHRSLMEAPLSEEDDETFQRVLDNISGQPWFAHNSCCRKTLRSRLRLLIGMKIRNANQLRTIAVSWALSDILQGAVQTKRN